MSIALSWSRLSDYLECPHKFSLKYVLKAFPPDDPAKKSIHLIKGEQLHRQLETYVLARKSLAPMPEAFSPEVTQTLPIVDKLLNAYTEVFPESQIACKIDWSPEEWFGKSVAWRAIWDLICLHNDHVFIGDYKSGKIYPYDKQYGQLHLSAVIALNRFDVDRVEVAYLYLEHKKPVRIQITQKDRPQIQKYFEQKYEEVQLEKAWAATPNNNCKWCPATVSQCKFSRKM